MGLGNKAEAFVDVVVAGHAHKMMMRSMSSRYTIHVMMTRAITLRSDAVARDVPRGGASASVFSAAAGNVTEDHVLAF